MGAGHGEQRWPASATSSPMRFTIALTPPRSRRAERQPGDGPQVLLELAGLGALDRPVAGVVHAGRDLVGQQLVADLEQLDGHHADVVEWRRGSDRAMASAPACSAGVSPGAGASVRRRMPVAVAVLDERVAGGRAVEATGGHDRQLPVEADHALGDDAVVAQARQRSGRRSSPGRHPLLAPAVVAASAGLHDGAAGEGDPAGRPRRRGDARRRPAPPSRPGGPAVAATAAGPRPHRHPLGQPREASAGTPSSSTVTTSQRRASSASARGSS